LRQVEAFVQLCGSTTQLNNSYQAALPACGIALQGRIGEGFEMRSIGLRLPALALVAVAMVAVAPAFGAELGADQPVVQFVSGTGEGPGLEMPVMAPVAFVAADEDDGAEDMNKMAAKLADPRMQDGVAAMIERMAGTMMNMPVGKFASAIEKAAPGAIKSKKRIREDATVADLAGRNADRLPADLAKGSKQMMGMLSGFAAAFASMIPEFEKMGDELEKGFDDAKSARRD
jgi:hypothetical protein